jgi:protein-disulfide isomerase
MKGSTDIMNMMQAQAMKSDGDIAAALTPTEEPTRPTPDDALAQAATTVGLTTMHGASSPGVAETTVYAFIDPYCGFCATAWDALVTKQALRSPGLKIKWIPFTLGDTPDLAIAMLGERSVERYTSIYRSTAKGVASSIAPLESPDTRAAYDKNQSLAKALRVTASPTFFYRTPTGAAMRTEGFSSASALRATMGIK